MEVLFLRIDPREKYFHSTTLRNEPYGINLTEFHMNSLSVPYHISDVPLTEGPSKYLCCCQPACPKMSPFSCKVVYKMPHIHIWSLVEHAYHCHHFIYSTPSASNHKKYTQKTPIWDNPINHIKPT